MKHPVEEAQREEHPDKAASSRKRKQRRIIRLLVIMVALALASLVGAYLFNNVSLMSDDGFSARLDESIEQAYQWLTTNRDQLQINIALYRMLQDADRLHADPLFEQLVGQILQQELFENNSWKLLLDPSRDFSAFNLNRLIEAESHYIDNQWILYALAPQRARLPAAAKEGLFDTEKYRHRQLTHQLWALIHLRAYHGGDDQLDSTIKLLCERMSTIQARSLPTVDIYLQRPAFILMAGHPELVRRRWIERVMAAQLPDGGWNDKWLCFSSGSRRPNFNIDASSNAHASVQGLWLLWQVKYRYPEKFGLNSH